MIIKFAQIVILHSTRNHKNNHLITALEVIWTLVKSLHKSLLWPPSLLPLPTSFSEKQYFSKLVKNAQGLNNRDMAQNISLERLR